MKKFPLPQLLACLCLLTCGVRGQKPAPPTGPVRGNRVLFVIETSVAMARDGQMVRQVIADLISTGLHGRMRDGDTFGIWTFQTNVSTEFPMQRWTRNTSASLATRVDDYVSSQRCAGLADTVNLSRTLGSIVKNSRRLYVVEITTGLDVIHGTPFDADINVLYTTYVRDLRKTHIPFITALAAHDGEFVDFAVSSAIGPIGLPELPVEIVDARIVPATNPPPPAVVQPPLVQEPARRREIIMTNSSPPAPLLVETNRPALPVPAPPATTNPAPPAIQTIVASNSPTAPAPVTSAVVAVPVPAPALSTNPNSPPPPARAVAQTIPAAPSAGSHFIRIGLVFLALTCVMLGWFLRGSRRADPSLISRSMEKK